MKRLLLVLVCVAASLCRWQLARAEDTMGDWEVTLANRQLDLTTHQARQTHTLTLSNADKVPLTLFLFAVDPALAGKVAYIGAHVRNPHAAALYLEHWTPGGGCELNLNPPQVKSDAEEPLNLPVTPATVKGKKDVGGYQVMLTGAVQPGGEVKVVVETVLINTIVPFPKEITQVYIYRERIWNRK